MKKKILIVDDQLAMHEALQALLSNQGYELAFASDGKEALTKAAQLIPDLILLDVMMPDMDGFEVCQRLRADSTLAQVPIIIVTALDNRDSRLRGIEAGADDFIFKPCDKHELQARIKTITNLNRYRRLLTEQAKFKWMIENSDEANLLLNKDNQILYANSKARLYLNQPTAEPINETFLALIAKHYRQVDKANKLPRCIMRPETKTAQAFWLQVDVMELNENYLVHLCDVTETILADREIWIFQTQINHKLKTPLEAISATQLLLDKLSLLTDAQIRKWLEMLNQERIHLQSDIEKILNAVDISRRPKQVPCNLVDILLKITTVKEMLGIESVLVSQENIENPENIFVSISCQILEIIFTELFLNAKKFHFNATPSIEVNIIGKVDGICFQVCDDGMALSPKQLDNMWIPYCQSKKYKSGEGLAMVGSLIWEVGGTCEAYNRTQGVVIELFLPVVKK